MTRIQIILAVSFTFLTTILSVPSEARIKMVALPERDMTMIRMDHELYTLIEEERILTLQEGVNHVDFSWNGVSIDPDSIRLQVLDEAVGVELLNVSYPPREEALVWELNSPDARQQRVRVSYLLSNIDRLFTYKGIAVQDETTLRLEADTVVRNFSGETFAQAVLAAGTGENLDFQADHEETKRLALFQRDGVAVEKVWRWDSLQQPWDPQRESDNVGIPLYYRLTNDADHGLGDATLAAGKIRVYQQDGHGGTIFLGEDQLTSTPRQRPVEIYIGDSRDVVVTQRQMVNQMVNVVRNKDNRVVLHDREQIVEATMENFKDTPATLTLVQHFPGEWEMSSSSLEYTVKDASTIEYVVELPAKSQKQLKMHYHLRHMR